jgi:hypothetical protein
LIEWEYISATHCGVTDLPAASLSGGAAASHIQNATFVQIYLFKSRQFLFVAFNPISQLVFRINTFRSNYTVWCARLIALQFVRLLIDLEFFFSSVHHNDDDDDDAIVVCEQLTFGTFTVGNYRAANYGAPSAAKNLKNKKITNPALFSIRICGRVAYRDWQLMYVESNNVLISCWFCCKQN